MFYISSLREDNFGLLFPKKLRSLCSIMQEADINTYI